MSSMAKAISHYKSGEYNAKHNEHVAFMQKAIQHLEAEVKTLQSRQSNPISHRPTHNNTLNLENTLNFSKRSRSPFIEK